MKREIDLSLSAYGVTRHLDYDVVILPWGATEPHNLHLPYLTDAILAHDVAVDAAQLAFSDHGIRAMVLPPVAMVRKLLIINGHGGNTFKSRIRDLAVDYPDFFILSSEWFTVLPAKEWFDAPGDHADELETSVMMHYHPELVELSEAGEGKANPFALQSLREKTAWLPRHWTQVTADTGIGNPCLATAEKGCRFAEAVAKKYATLLKELAAVQCEQDFYATSL